MKVYYKAKGVVLYHGDCREARSCIKKADVIVTDPPYAETNFAWDQWPERWPWVASLIAPQMWCFGSLRMFMRWRDDFACWKQSQEVVWEKHNGSNMFNDRFRRVHELVAHFYRDEWKGTFKQPQFTYDAKAKSVRRMRKPAHWNGIRPQGFVSVPGGPRLMRSVIAARSCHRVGVHPTQKPLEVLKPIISYSCPPGGTVLDLFAGSGATLVASVQLGMKAIGIELQERYCELAAKALSKEAQQ